jgi:hypothetical protein
MPILVMNAAGSGGFTFTGFLSEEFDVDKDSGAVAEEPATSQGITDSGVILV